MGFWTLFLENRVVRRITLWCGVALAAGLALVRVFYAGKAAERASQTEARLNAIKQAKKVEDDVAAIGASDVDRRLSRWMRDGR